MRLKLASRAIAVYPCPEDKAIASAIISKLSINPKLPPSGKG
ncbi:MAG: hypothetical protein ACK58N_09245 [Synechocystis sp.]